jgi:DNA-binding NarL/FixJ family response regulator
VVILHAALPGEDAFGLANRLRVSRPPLRIVLLVTEIPRDLRRRADIAGVNGIIALRDTTEAVVLAVRSALGGRQFISQTVLDWVAADIASSRGSVSAGAHRLTPREREVLQYLTDAKTVKETASILGLAVNTVDNHKTRLMKKLNVHSCVELTRLAIREGMISF